MTYTNAEKMILNAKSSGSESYLSALLNKLSNPHKNIGIIKVFGGSGKSSVCSLLSAVLSAAGYRVGCLTTPFIQSARNSIRVCEKAVSIEHFTNSAEKVYRAIVDSKKECEQGKEFAPSQGDILLATAFTAFEDAACDLAIIEIGGCGRSHSFLERPIISVITTVQDSETSSAICAQLDRESGEIITALQSRDIYKMIFDKCANLNRRLTMPLKNSFVFMETSIKHMEFTYKGNPYSIGCGAYYQTHNLLTVYETVEALRRAGLKIPGTDICSAVLNEGFPLRFELISVLPTIIVDRADTEGRQKSLIESLKMLNEHISKAPIFVCENKSRNFSELLATQSFDTVITEMSTKGIRKPLRELIASLKESDTLIITGSSEYCEQIAKLTKEFLM